MEHPSISGIDFLLAGGDVAIFTRLYYSKLIEKCFFFVNTADQRVANWALMGNPLPLISILAAYLFIVYRVGPA